MGAQNNTNNKKKQHRGAKAYQYKYWEHPKNDRVQKLPVSQLKPFEEQPFKVLLDESMDELVESNSPLYNINDMNKMFDIISY